MLILNSQGLDKVVVSTCKELFSEFQDNIFDKYGKNLYLPVMAYQRLTLRQRRPSRMQRTKQASLQNFGVRLSIERIVQLEDTVGLRIRQ